MLQDSRLRVVLGVLVAAAFLLGGWAFVDTERTYMGYLARGEVSSTVTGYDVVTSGAESVVTVDVEVSNPTHGTITLERVASVAAYAPGTDSPVGRVDAAVFDVRVPPGGTETVELTISPTDRFGSLAQPLEAGELVLSGHLSATIAGERFQVTISDGGDA